MKETALKLSIHFPVRPHIYKFLSNRFGEQFTYSKTSPLSPIIKSVLNDNGSSDLIGFRDEMYYEVVIPRYYFNNNEIMFSNKKIYQFNSDVDHIFREELYRFMVLNQEIYDIKFRTSFRDFLKRMDITENDVKFETLLKQFQRNYRKIGEQSLGTVH